MKKRTNKTLETADKRSRRRFPAAKAAYYSFLAGMAFLAYTQPVYAATDVWTKASEIMQDVYNQIVIISTVAAIVTASVALLLMNFSRSGRTVDESRAWLKRICITWVILNGLGFIMAYVTPFFTGGKWTPTP
ncbi:MAG: fimbrial protein [Lachnospiraceae bacterium]|nr:fimbrial protein [Lachnospiraceae bacterium]